MKYSNIYVFLFVILGLTGCKDNTHNKKEKEREAVMAKSTGDVFKLPDIPIALNTPEGRSEFLVTHYWDNFDFNDTVSINKPEVVEQIFVDFVDMLGRVPMSTIQKAITILMEHTSQKYDVQKYFIELFDKYLYDPNSPFRNEELYIPVLEYIVASPTVKSEDKITSEYRLKMAMKNRMGSVATNFVFAERDGHQRQLTDVNGEYIVLYFNNPGCSGCKETAAKMKMSSFGRNPKVTVLAIYPDADLPEWKETQHEFPKEWIDGYSPNGEIMEKELYDLKAIPTLYLLDKDRKVILKDADWTQIEMYFSQNLM